MEDTWESIAQYPCTDGVYRDILNKKHAVFHLAELLEKNGNHDKVKELLWLAQPFFGMDVDFLLRAACLLLRCGKLVEAKSLAAKLKVVAQRDTPLYLESLLILGSISHAGKEYFMAAKYLEKYCSKECKNTSAMVLLGEAYFNSLRYEEANEVFEAAWNLMLSQPSYDENLLIRIYAYFLSIYHPLTVQLKKLNPKFSLIIPSIFQSREHLQECFELSTESSQLLLTSFFHLSYSPYNLHDFMKRNSENYRKWVGLQVVGTSSDKEYSSGRIKLGFASSYLRKHTVGNLFKGLIKKLPKEMFDVHVYNLMQVKQDDPVVYEISKNANQVDLSGMTLEEQQDLIAKASLDVLIFPDIGMCPFSTQLAHHRLAPIQCASWGHPCTTGISTIDYFISSKRIEVPEAQHHYSEKLIRLDRIPCYIECPEEMEGQSCFEPGDHVYGCFYSLFKIHPDFDCVIKKILEKDPRGIVVLVKDEENIPFLFFRFEKTLGNLISRIQALPLMQFNRYLQLLGQFCVLLDPLYFGCGKTAYDCFSQDVPIITYPTEMMRGRIVNGLYDQMGVDGCVAKDLDEYVEIALRCGNDPLFREEMSHKIAQNKHKIFSDELFVQEFAKVMARLVRKW